MEIDEDLLVLQDGAMRLTLAPQLGGAIRELTWSGKDVLRPAPQDDCDDPFAMACFAMVPYVNRVAHGRFSFRGRAVQLRRNWSEDPHPLHGQGWRVPWYVLDATSVSATLGFEGGGDEWPWHYRSEQRFELAPSGLTVELSIENLSDTPMPAMLGLHPYFPTAARAQMHARMPRVWLADREALPTEEALTPPDWRFDPARPVAAVPLDHCFSGWDGVASLRWPDRVVTLRAPHCRHLHVYAPAGREFFCIEPQTAAPGALARGEATVVAPAERFAISVNFAVGAA
jgi:aldose 1-epimerase